MHCLNVPVLMMTIVVLDVKSWLTIVVTQISVRMEEHASTWHQDLDVTAHQVTLVLTAASMLMTVPTTVLVPAPALIWSTPTTAGVLLGRQGSHV